jgi:2-polyprenyl-3-methyl-5-hydroxy-6-metoxy-1,4-benzoquinol methylase
MNENRKKEYYEMSYREKKHFSFGKNWHNFLKGLNNEKIDEAKKSIMKFLDCETLEDRTFIDIGCGSGLFSLAAYKLGASKVISLDIDEFSLKCVRYLKEKESNPSSWEIKSGSALDENLNSLGTFDVVYSWGVLHHTGDMYKALENVKKISKLEGVIYLALYNKYSVKLRGGTSKFWFWVKKTYNHSGSLEKMIFEFIFMSYGIFGMLICLKNPIAEIRNYKSNRGMSWYHDRIDWLGGFPYEFATVDEIVNFYGSDNFLCKKIKSSNGIGCNEYLFVNKNEK